MMLLATAVEPFIAARRRVLQRGPAAGREKLAWKSRKISRSLDLSLALSIFCSCSASRAVCVGKEIAGETLKLSCNKGYNKKT